eukprot:8744367-Pyramimonas_sp.AAC.1
MWPLAATWSNGSGTFPVQPPVEGASLSPKTKTGLGRRILRHTAHLQYDLWHSHSCSKVSGPAGFWRGSLGFKWTP